MILKQFGVYVELTDQAVLLRVSKKETRELPYDTIERVEFPEVPKFGTNKLRFQLVGDTTTAGRLTLDKNEVNVAGGAAKDREQIVAFVGEIARRVASAHPKTAHPNLLALVSNPDQLVAAERATAKEEAARQREAESAAKEAKRRLDLQDQRRAALEQRQQLVRTIGTDTDVAGHLKRALAYAAAGDIESEHFSVHQATTLATQKYGNDGADVLSTWVEELRTTKKLHGANEKSAPLTKEQAHELYARQVSRLLDLAVEAIKVGDVRTEHSTLSDARRQAKAAGGSAEVKQLESRLGRMLAERGIQNNSRYLGKVAPEGRLEASDRTQRLGNLFASQGVAIEVYTDRVIRNGSCWPIDEFTTAEVYMDGERQRVSNRHLRERHNVYDNRHASFMVAGSGWSFKVQVAPDKIDGPRQLANQINMAASRVGSMAARADARAVAQSAVAPQASPVAGSLVEQLERLVTLHTSGSLTDEEFAMLKSSLLRPVAAVL